LLPRQGPAHAPRARAAKPAMSTPVSGSRFAALEAPDGVRDGKECGGPSASRPGSGAPSAPPPAARLLTPEDECRVAAAAEESLADMLRWASMPEEWWDEKRVSHVGGAEMQLYTKRSAFPEEHGQCPPLFLGVIVLDDISLDDLRYLTAAGEGVAKLRFDPSLATFETLLTMEALEGEPIRLLRTHTRPMLLGLISAREVDSICMQRQLPDGRWIAGGFGLQSPRLAPRASDTGGGSGSSGGGGGVVSLQALREAPTTVGMVQALDFASGYIFEPVDAAAKAGGRGRCRSWYFLSTEAGGGVPRWAGEKGTSTAISNFWIAALKELKRKRHSEQ